MFYTNMNNALNHAESRGKEPGYVEVITIACAFVGFGLVVRVTLQATGDVVTIACMEVVIAIGSMLFHATLRYSMQLADEIPMIWRLGC